MISVTIHSKFLKKHPDHIFVLGDKYIFSDIEKNLLSWEQTKCFMEITKIKYKQLEYKSNLKYINEQIKKLKTT